MSVTTGDVVAMPFTTTNPTTGAAADADGLPTGTLYVNAVANAATVTIADLAGTGKYSFSVTMPTLTTGQRVAVLVDATIAGLACSGDVWTDQAVPAVNVTLWKDATAPAMTGDAYARLGAPAGASVSADIAALPTDADVQAAATAALAAYDPPTKTELDSGLAAIPAAVAAEFASVGVVPINEDGATLDDLLEEMPSALLLSDWETLTGTVPDRSTLNALRFLRNRWAASGGALTVYEEDDTTPAWEALLTTNSSADRITGSVPE